jgi:phage shock protein A
MPLGWFIAIALIVAVIGSAGLSSLLTVRAVNRKTISEAQKADEDADLADASARKVVSEASAMLLEPLMRRAKALEEQLAIAQAEVEQLRGQVHQMSKEMGELRDENTVLRLGQQPPDSVR